MSPLSRISTNLCADWALKAADVAPEERGFEPVEQYEDFVLHADEFGQIDGAPEYPGGEAVSFYTLGVGECTAVADVGEHAHVTVAKIFRRFPAHNPV